MQLVWRLVKKSNSQQLNRLEHGVFDALEKRYVNSLTSYFAGYLLH